MPDSNRELVGTFNPELYENKKIWGKEIVVLFVTKS